MKMSIEPHGDGYAIYLGRGSDHHGFDAAYANDVDEKLIDDVIRRINSFDEMLEALIDAVRTIKAECDDYGDRWKLHPLYSEYNYYRSIVEKATGKTWEEIKENNE